MVHSFLIPGPLGHNFQAWAGVTFSLSGAVTGQAGRQAGVTVRVTTHLLSFILSLLHFSVTF